MIKPKHSFEKKNFEVTEKFIDREEAKNHYRNKLCSNTEEYNILVFYGVSGIGKSKLRKEICRIHADENKEAIMMYLDLNAADDRNPGTGILKLADSCNAKVDFKCFELAYALYFRKKHPSISYGREKEFFSENTFIGIGRNIIDLLDGGITSFVTDITEKIIKAISSRMIPKEVAEELKHFNEHSVVEMEEWLPAFFAFDLSCYLEKHPNAKTLIVFDTFDALNENVIEPIHRSKNERWIQAMIACFSSKEFPNLLFTVFGRDKLTWDEEWMTLLEQYPLKEFDDSYSKEYFKKSGIEDLTIMNAMINSSKGYPFLLYLSLETYANIINNGRIPAISDFGGSYPEMIERFLYNLDKDTVEALRLLSVPNFYNSEIFESLIRKFHVPFPVNSFEQLNKYSFVSLDEVNEEYYIHDLMRKGIIEKTSEAFIRSIHQFMLSFYSKKPQKELEMKNLNELIYHARNGLSCDEFNSWLVTPLEQTSSKETPLFIVKKLQERGEQSFLIQLIGGIIKSFSLEKICIELVNIYIDIVHLGGDYKTAVSICEHYLEQFDEEKLSNEEPLIKMKVRKIHHSMFYMPVNRLIADAEKILETTAADSFPETFNELLFLLGGNLGILSGDLKYAQKWLDKSMRYAKEDKLESFIHRSVRKQADIMLADNDIKGAFELINQTISIEDPVDTRYKTYLMGVLGEVYRKQGEFEKAMRCFEIVYKKSAENNLPGWKAHSFLGKGMVEIARGNYKEAKELLDRADVLYHEINQEWGEINTKTAKLLLMKASREEFDNQEIKKCRKNASKMNYQYNMNYLDELGNGRENYFQLFFL